MGYRGPDEAFAVLDANAVIRVPTYMELAQGLDAFRAVVLDTQKARAMMTASALLIDARFHWFMGDKALRAQPTPLGLEAVSRVAPLLRGGPHWRCAEHALLRTPAQCGDACSFSATCADSEVLGS